jgi:hypothetical protein
MYKVDTGKTYDHEGLRKYLDRYLPRRLFLVFYDTEKNIKYRAFMGCHGYHIERWDDEDERWVSVSEY